MLKGKRYSIETIRNLPANVNGFSVSCKADDNICPFFGELHSLSNFHPSPFEVDGIKYSKSEQFIQNENDVTTESRIWNVTLALRQNKES